MEWKSQKELDDDAKKWGILGGLVLITIILLLGRALFGS
jgi:hypothetical protein